jgi:hypothetical protein
MKKFHRHDMFSLIKKALNEIEDWGKETTAEKQDAMLFLLETKLKELKEEWLKNEEGY